MAHLINNPEEKLTYYRKAAHEAEKNAARATDPDVRSAYLAIMRTWVYLADELEREVSVAGDDLLGSDRYVPPRTNGDRYRSH